MVAETSNRYPELATKIAEWRGARGLSQAEFAARLGHKQQTVSRWEAGTHRPSVDQIPTLAGLMDEEASTLMLLAGYGIAPVSSLSTLFPVDALDPDTFEKFVEHLVIELFPNADVNMQGSRGHTQNGTDIIARFEDGSLYSFQCKRVERFGESAIKKAILDHTLEANRKFLVLSKIGRPQDFDLVAAHQGWALWDKQLLTRKVRSLPDESQDRLVDTFFRCQRMALLGRNEPGPWLTIKEYYRPFLGRSSFFNHDWPLMGRDDEIEKLANALEDTEQSFTMLVGPGGIGKTRVLKEALARFEENNKGVAIRFLSASQDANSASLAALGNGRKLLVVDDAHDREGLKLLIEHVVNEGNKAKLFIATRPYAEQRILNELGNYNVLKPATVRLHRLDKESLHKLVVEVLREFGGHHTWAPAIVEAASDSPLVATMAARLVAVEGINPKLATSDESFRQCIFSHFEKVSTGHLGSNADAPVLKAVLEVLALIQPFHIDDRRVAELVQVNRPTIVTSDVTNALKLLVDGGVIYNRGSLYRLMPDLLGDILIEKSCIGADGQLSEFAKNIAFQVESDRLAQVLVNLGRTDWRLTNGDTANSKLLEPIWQILRTIDTKYDRRIGAVESVAFYQPKQALGFVQAQIDQGRYFAEFGNILKRIAYTSENRREVLRLLWELGQQDDRALNASSGHPIRILGDLAGYDMDKPIAFNEEVAEFAFGLLDDPDAWKGQYTPFDVLKPLLRAEVMTAQSIGRRVSMSSFFVSHDVVAKLRSRLIDRVIDLLEEEDNRTALHAARMVGEALRAPHGMLNSAVPDELDDKYKTEFIETINRVRQVLEKGELAPTTIIGLIRSLDWFAHHGTGELRDLVNHIFERLPSDLDFRFHAAVTEGAEWTFVGQVPFTAWREDKDWLGGFVAELLEAFPDRKALCDALLVKLETVSSVGLSLVASNQLVQRLISSDPQIGEIILDRSLKEPENYLRSYLGYAVGALLELQPENGYVMIRRMLASPELHIRTGGASGLIVLNRSYNESDIKLLEDILCSNDSPVVLVGIRAIRMRRNLPSQQVIRLLIHVKLDNSPNLLEEIAAVLCDRSTDLLAKLQESDVDQLLEQMKTLPQLEGYWTHELLKILGRRYGQRLGQFVIDRADMSLSKKDDVHYQPLPYSCRRGGLSLEESPDVVTILERVWLWLQDYDQVKVGTRYLIGEIVASMFKFDSAPVIEFLEAMLDRATASDLRWINYVLGDCDYLFVLNQHRFIERYLKRCKAVEPELVKIIVDQFSATAMSGGWSGTFGEPMPRDIQTRDDAEKILATISRLSPAYRLYNVILEDAKRNIERSKAEAAAFDDDDDD